MLRAFKRSAIFRALMVALALAPALLYACLGQFSRPLPDDHCSIAVGQERGAWQGMLYWLQRESGAYSSYFFNSALAPLDTLLPRITPALIIVFWLVGLSWLIDEGLARLRISHSRRPLAVALAALAVAAAINSLHSPQSFYWYASSVRYILPSALLTIYLALVFGRRRHRASLWLTAAGGLLCFVTAGASEMFLVFQLTFLALCLLVSLAWRCRAYARILSVGWLATLVGLMIQWNAPGVALRTAATEASFGRPDRSLLALLSKTFDGALEAVGEPRIFAGFVLLLMAGLLAALFTYQPPKTLKTSKSVELVSSALWPCLAFQLLWLPLLWSRVSDTPQFLGRFSPRYMIIIGLNLAFISVFAILLWRRRRINAHLQRHERGLYLFCNALLLIFAALFALSQLTNYYLPASWLFATALMFLGLLGWQLSSALPGAQTRKIGLLALCSLIIGLACLAAIVGVAVFGRGYAPSRILAPAACLLTFSGLIWGFLLGCLAKHLPYRYGQAWITRLKLTSLAAALIIGLGIMLGQAARIPNFQRYAQGWDERHLDIIAQRDRGQAIIEIAPLPYYLADYDDAPPPEIPKSCTNRYYGVDAIVVRDD